MPVGDPTNYTGNNWPGGAHGACPTCGHCPACGRGGYYGYWPVSTQPPYSPFWSGTATSDGVDSTMTSEVK